MSQSAGFCCNMHAMSTAERARYHVLREQLEAAVRHTEELADGYAFQLQNDHISLVELAEWVSYERKCCPFFHLAIGAAQGNKPVTLSITGEPGVKEFIRAEFAAVNFR